MPKAGSAGHHPTASGTPAAACVPAHEAGDVLVSDEAQQLQAVLETAPADPALGRPRQAGRIPTHSGIPGVSDTGPQTANSLSRAMARPFLLLFWMPRGNS